MNHPIDITGVVLNTERLILRNWKQSDLDDLFEYASVDGVGEKAGWPHHTSKDVSQMVLNSFIEEKKTFCIEYNGKAIGSLGIENYDTEVLPELDDKKAREIGFVIGRDYWGKGFVTEAAKAVIDYLFDAVGLDVIVCGHFLSNVQSQRAQFKLGFRDVRTHTYKTQMQTEQESMYSLLWKNSNYIDLHMHTGYSDDGTYETRDLIKKCHEANLKIVSICDHNCVKANREAMDECKKYGISYIPAVEIDCTYKDINLHVVGYGIDYENEEFNELGISIMKQEQANREKSLKLTRELGFHVDTDAMDRICTKGVYYGEAYAETILADQRNDDNEMLLPYRKGGSRSDNPYVNFYWDFYAKGKPCYTRVIYPSLEETIKMIHENGGKAILAHPGNNLKGQFEVFDEMVKMGLDGVEAFSSYHDKETCDYFYRKAQEKKVYVTCGSDFHGKTKPNVFLGFNQAEDYYDEIENNLKEMKLI